MTTSSSAAAVTDPPLTTARKAVSCVSGYSHPLTSKANGIELRYRVIQLVSTRGAARPSPSSTRIRTGPPAGSRMRKRPRRSASAENRDSAAVWTSIVALAGGESCPSRVRAVIVGVNLEVDRQLVGAERHRPHRRLAAAGHGERLLPQRRIAQELSQIGVEASPPKRGFGRLDDQRRNRIDRRENVSQLAHQPLIGIWILGSWSATIRSRTRRAPGRVEADPGSGRGSGRSRRSACRAPRRSPRS